MPEQPSRVSKPLYRIPQTQDIATLNELIIESISDKKGLDIVSLDLRHIEEAIADFFILCTAESTTQVKAIADHIYQQVKENTGDTPWHTEGRQNLEWVLIDYVDTVVHIFLRDKRAHYNLEELWSDATRTDH
jgi:ribosome-associated protein